MKIFIFNLALACCVSFIIGCEEDAETTEVDRIHMPPLQHDSSWASGPWPWEWNLDGDDDVNSEGLIEIKPGAKIHLLHGLGRRPVEVHAYVGFAANDDRVMMPASGNSVEIEDADEESITIRNGSGGSFFYRFILR